MQQTYDDLYAKSKNGELFPKLMDIVLSRENILLAYRNIKANSGSNTPGTDQLTIENIGCLSTEEIVDRVRRIVNGKRGCCPKPVRRKDIPKPNGSPRPLGIPCIWDRLIQQCIKQVMEPICEALLGGEAKNPVGVALQGGEVIKSGRLFEFVLALQLSDHNGLIGAGLAQGFGIRFAFHAFTASLKSRKHQRDLIERLWLESVNFCFSLYDPCQCRRHHAPDIQRTVIENGEEPRGVNAYQPIGLAAAKRRRIEIIVCAAVFERFKTLA